MRTGGVSSIKAAIRLSRASIPCPVSAETSMAPLRAALSPLQAGRPAAAASKAATPAPSPRQFSSYWTEAGRLPAWLKAWMPPELMGQWEALVSWAGPIVQAVLEAVPALAGAVTFLAWALWGLGAALVGAPGGSARASAVAVVFAVADYDALLRRYVAALQDRPPI